MFSILEESIISPWYSKGWNYITYRTILTISKDIKKIYSPVTKSAKWSPIFAAKASFVLLLGRVLLVFVVMYSWCTRVASCFVVLYSCCVALYSRCLVLSRVVLCCAVLYSCCVVLSRVVLVLCCVVSCCYSCSFLN